MRPGKVFVGAKVQPYQRSTDSQLRLATGVRTPTKVRSSRHGKTSSARPSLASLTVLYSARPAPRVLLFLVGSACLLWTLLLLQLTVAPNYTVNWVMSTETFDAGSFWLLVDPTPTVLALGILGLWGVAVGFLSLLFRIVKLGKPLRRKDSSGAVISRPTLKHLADANSKWRRVATSALRMSKEILAGDSVMGYFVKASLKLGDFLMDAVLLFLNLEAGSPVILVAIFTAITVASALSSAVLLAQPSTKNSLLVETLLDTLFDFLIAIAYPAMALMYCFSTFTFDHKLLEINLAIYPAGWFETVASVMADPVQTAIIHKLLKSLRIVSVLDFFARVGVNTFLCVRLHWIVGLLHDPSWRLKRPFNVDAKHRYFAGAFLLCLAVIVIVFVEESVRTSALACKPHAECAVHAWRWTFIQEDSISQCPCLTLIDGDTAPKTYAEWTQPKGVSDKVAQLATTGDLQTLQLTNRFLPFLPSELKGCKRLKHVSLVYTHTHSLPDWFKDFVDLEYLHIEGAFEDSLTSLPDNLFDNMPSLTFIHLAAHKTLPRLPPFRGTPGLKSLTLAVLLSITELPSFENLRSLERLQLSSMPVLDRLPDLEPITSTLKSFVVADRGTWCCNGFLGSCDLQNVLCGVHPLYATPAASCWTGDTATTETMELVHKFSDSLCGDVIQAGTLESSPSEAEMAQCNGTLYRECHVPGYPTAMCYSARLMGIACSPNPYPRAMRRRQIKEGVGVPCNAEYEAWLGCT